MLMEMSLKQLYTKIVPYTHMKDNNKMLETDDEKEKIKVKYWFMNLAYRCHRKQMEHFECVKIIYDMQDSTLFIFCSRSYASWFVDYMEETYRFRMDEGLQINNETPSPILEASSDT